MSAAVLDHNGAAHHRAGAPASIGGQFAAQSNTARDSEELQPAAVEEEREHTPGIWSMPVEMLDRLRDSVAKANRRLERAGIEERFSYTWERRVEEHDGKRRVYADVTLSRPSISIGEWRFHAAHERTAAGKVLSYYAGAPNDDHERTDIVDMRCDHCGKSRGRAKVYTVQHAETGDIKQVGHSCLAIFLGVKPEGLWAMVADPGREEEYDDGGYSTSGAFGVYGEGNVFDGESFMLGALRIVKQDGEYIPATRATIKQPSTVDQAKELYASGAITPATDDERAELEAIEEWAAGLANGSDYERNLHAALARDEHGHFVLSKKHAAIAASAISAYKRNKEWAIERQARAEAQEAKRRAEQEGKLKEFYGEPGQQLKGQGLTAKIVKMNRGTDYGYGAPMHVTLMDAAGHVFYWKASAGTSALHPEDEDGRQSSLEVGQTVRFLGGSIKEHRVSDYNGDHETVLQRVRLERVIADDA